MTYMIVLSNGELYHSGVKGQKWGVRRYQNEDGTLTEAGKKRYRVSTTSDSEKKKMSPETKKKIVKGVAIGTAVVGAAALTAFYMKRNPGAMADVMKAAEKIKGLPKTKLAAGQHPTSGLRLRIKGEKAVKKLWSQAKTGAIEGVVEGAKDGPKKFAKAMVVGGVMLGGYKALEKSVGKSVANQIMSANNPKKIDKYYKKNQNNEDD